MKLHSAIAIAAIALGLTVGSVSSQADSYPDHPVSLMVGFAPGGPADTLARILAKDMSENLGQPVVVENKPGAGSTLAAREIAHADADGYHIFFASSGHAGNYTYYPNLDYAPKDFVGIAGIARTPIVITTGPKSPFATLEDLLAELKAKPDTLTYSAGGGGATLTALAAETFLRAAGVKAIAVSYPGSGPQNVDLMGGVLDFAFDTVSGSASLIQNNQIKALAVTSEKPSELFPDIPTVAKSGVPGFQAALGWFGLLAPAGTEEAAIAKLNGAVSAALGSEAIKKQLAGFGLEAMPMGPQEFDNWLQSETERWGKLIKELGLSAE